MKNFFKFLFSFFLLFSVVLKSDASISFDEAFEQSDKKPMLVLVYADWAENYENYLEKFRNLEKEFGETFNYVELNIASPDTKSFNTRYHIYPNLPYVLMFRNNGKVSRYVQRNCVSSESCIVPRLKQFIQ